MDAAAHERVLARAHERLLEEAQRADADSVEKEILYTAAAMTGALAEAYRHEADRAEERKEQDEHNSQD